MAARQRKESSRYPILKYIASPLAQIYYNSFTEMLCNTKLYEGRNTSFLLPSTLQHFHQINHLSNTTKRLEAEIDSMIKSTYLQQSLIRYRLSFLLAIQQEKLNHAIAALQELRWYRNALGMRLLMYEGGSVPYRSVSAWLFAAADEDFSDAPFEVQDLLLNCKFATASGVTGNSSRAPVDDDLMYQMAAAFQQQIPGVSNTLLVTGVDYEVFKEVNSAVTSMLKDHQPRKLPSIEMDYLDCVLGAFSLIAAELNDPMQRFIPFKARVCEAEEKRSVIQDIVHYLEIAAKRAQELLEKLGEKGRMTYVGEFLQYATLPCFYEVYDESSDASLISSTSLLRDADYAKEEEIFGNLDPSEQDTQELEYPHNEQYCFCYNKQQDELLYCEGCEGCKFAKDGWFHPKCLGIKSEQVGEHFYCPGCHVAAGSDFKTYGDEWQIGKRKIQEIRRYLLDIWKRVFNLDLSKKGL